MLIDFGKKLTDFNGNPVKQMNGDKSLVDASLSSVCVEALMARFPDETLSAEQQLSRYALAKAIHKAEALEITTDDIVLLKRLLAKGYGPAIVGAACEILDPAAIK